MTSDGQIRVNVFAPSSPHLKQWEVLRALDSSRWVLLRAGRKWRKTSLNVSWLFRKAIETKLTCPYIAPNRIQAKNIAWDDHVQRILDEFTLKGLPYKKNQQDLSVTIHGGGKVQLLGVENKEALRGISNWGAVGLDEYDDWQEDIFPTIIRPNLITHNAPALITGTPKGFRNLYRLENSGLFKSFHYTSMDNPDIDPKELEELKREYLEMGMSYYRQEILAEYEKPVGTVYEEWDMETQFIPIGYNPDLPLHLSWDFGVNDPTAILFLQPYGGEIRLVDYYEASNASIAHFTNWISERGYKKPELETGDIAGRQRTLISNKSVISELRDLGHTIRSMPIPDIESQVRNTHRIIPKLIVSSSNPRCSRFRDCILNYHYPSKPVTIINQENEAPVHDEFSHALKALEYYAWNLTHGGLGGVKENQTDKFKKEYFANMGDGGQLSIDPDLWI